MARAEPELGGFQGLKYTRREEPGLLLHPSTPTAQTERGQHLPVIHLGSTSATRGALVLGATCAAPAQPRSRKPVCQHHAGRTETWLEGRARGKLSTAKKRVLSLATRMQAPTRAGAVQDPALCCPSLLGALRQARAVLTILDMAPRDCHITTPHIASRCSDGFAAAALLASLCWESSRAACSQTQALAGNQLTLHPPSPLCRGERGWRSQMKHGQGQTLVLTPLPIRRAASHVGSSMGPHSASAPPVPPAAPHCCGSQSLE